MLMYVDTGVLILRLVIGLIFVGHGAQKLFGWFGGHGLAGHTVMMEKLEAHPAHFWAWVSALGEFLGDLGLALGLLPPLAASRADNLSSSATRSPNW
jgi:putative oxidoreductase